MNSFIKPVVLYSNDETDSGGAEPSGDAERVVSLAEHGRIRQRAADLEKKLSALEKAEEDRRQAQLSETERLKEERDQAIKKSENLEQRIVRDESAAHVLAAASKARFIEPEDAVPFIDLDTIKSRQDADRAVAQVAKRKQHLVASEKTPAELTQVLKGGLPTEPVPAGGNGQRTETDLRKQEAHAILSAIEGAQGKS